MQSQNVRYERFKHYAPHDNGHPAAVIADNTAKLWFLIFDTKLNKKN